MKKIIFILLSSVICLGVAAQGRIDRVIADLENKKDVETTYSERRTAKKHKLYRTTTVLTYKTELYTPRIVKAFEDEREKAVSAVKTRDTYTFKFVDDKGTSTYIFNRRHRKVVKSWSSADDNGEGDGSSTGLSSDPANDVYITSLVRSIEREASQTAKSEAAKARRECANQARQAARRQAEAKKELARQKREFEKQQREFARLQREFERQQATFRRQLSQQQRDLATLK